MPDKMLRLIHLKAKVMTMMPARFRDQNSELHRLPTDELWQELLARLDAMMLELARSEGAPVWCQRYAAMLKA